MKWLKDILWYLFLFLIMKAEIYAVSQRSQLLRGGISHTKRIPPHSYIARFLPVAQAEQRKYGIPVSITLGQAMLESDCGNSRLARVANNHFGIKCFATNCGRGHCIGHHDDDPGDRFVHYANAWESFRAHSRFLMKNKYRSAFGKGYKDCIIALVLNKYATSPTYGDDLARKIEEYDLTKYDDVPGYPFHKFFNFLW